MRHLRHLFLLFLCMPYINYSMDDTIVAQQIVSSLSTRLFNRAQKYMYLQDNTMQTEHLYISSTSPIGVSYTDGSTAKINQSNNLPDPQYWVKPIEEQDRIDNKPYNVRFSWDRPQSNKSPINVNFVCNPQSSYKHTLLFDGPNNQNQCAHAQVDPINGQSVLYLFPSTNKNNRSGGIYDDTDSFKFRKMEGCISTIALHPVANTIAYCSHNELSKNSSFHLVISDDSSTTFFPIAQSLKKILFLNRPNNNFACLGLSDSGKLFYINPKAISQKPCIEQNTTLYFADIAIDPETNDMAFLDTEGKIYTAKADNLATLEHIYTLNKINCAFVERISYYKGICTIIYHTHEENRLFNGYCERIVDGASLGFKRYILPFAGTVLLISFLCYKYLYI